MLLFRRHSGTPALKTEDFSKRVGCLVKHKDGFTKTIFWTANPGKKRRTF